jgi:hypothetical protein
MSKLNQFVAFLEQFEAKLFNNQIRHFSPAEDSKVKTSPRRSTKVPKKISKV